MKQAFLLLLLLATSYASLSQTAEDFRGNATDTFYGRVVHDPYRAMEDTSSAELKEWMRKEAAQTEAFFASMPGRQKLYEEMMAAYKVTKDIPVGTVYYWRGKHYVQQLNAGEEYEKFYEVNKAGKYKLLFDPRKLHPEITSKNVRMSVLQFSPNSPWLAYSLTVGGYEFEPRFVLHNMETGKEIYDTLYTTMGKAISAFDPDDPNAFYYEYYPQFNKPGLDPNRWFDSLTVWRHVMGSDPATDKLMIDFNPAVIKRSVDDLMMLWVEKDVPYVFAMVKNLVAAEYRIYTAPRKAFTGTGTPWKRLTDWDDKISAYAMKDNWLYLLTTKGAGNGKVLRVDLRRPSLAEAVELVPPSKKIVREISVTKDELLVTALDAGVGKLYRIPHGATGLDSVTLPVSGHIAIRLADRSEPGFLAQVTSYSRPLTLYQYNAATKRFAPSVLEQNHPKDVNPLTVEEVKVKSHDGVEVPMTIVSKKGLKLDGTHPVSLNAYGAYGRQESPSFFNDNMIWFGRGGISVFAHVRGGGVYGEDWHLAGQKATKPNTWKDLIACAQWLVDRKYATTKNLVAAGGSASGIAVGRAVTERPDLFGGIRISVGALDMIRFETSPNGAGNVPEFGSVKTEEGFKALYAMSTYHNIKDGTAFPPVLFSAGINDNRVPVWMTLKAAARMRAANASANPVLLRLNFDAGHGGQGTMSEQIKQAADIRSFSFWRAGFPEFQPKQPVKAF